MIIIGEQEEKENKISVRKQGEEDLGMISIRRLLKNCKNRNK